jgi:hypothetical protein
MKRSIMWLSVFILWALFWGVFSKAHACYQETLIIDGQVVVCSVCEGVIVCDKDKIWKN